MEPEGVPDVLKLKWIVEWFSGEALTIVEAKLNNNVNEDASVTFSSIKDTLQDAYGVEDRDFCANAILTQLVKGELIPMGDFKKTQSFIINVENKYELAKGRGKLVEFDIKSMYTQEGDQEQVIQFQRFCKVCQEDGKRTGGDCGEYRRR
jgi:hypothetical protein